MTTSNRTEEFIDRLLRWITRGKHWEFSPRRAREALKDKFKADEVAEGLRVLRNRGLLYQLPAREGGVGAHTSRTQVYVKEPVSEIEAKKQISRLWLGYVADPDDPHEAERRAFYLVLEINWPHLLAWLIPDDANREEIVIEWTREAVPALPQWRVT